MPTQQHRLSTAKNRPCPPKRAPKQFFCLFITARRSRVVAKLDGHRGESVLPLLPLLLHFGVCVCAVSFSILLFYGFTHKSWLWTISDGFVTKGSSPPLPAYTVPWPACPAGALLLAPCWFRWVPSVKALLLTTLVVFVGALWPLLVRKTVVTSLRIQVLVFRHGCSRLLCSFGCGSEGN
jgi:hypothetical protein